MKKRYYYLFIGIALIFILLQGSLMPQQKKRRKSRPCKNCFSVNFNDVEMHDWLKTMASLIRKNILVDDSVKGKITVISYQKIPESRALAFMKQVLEIKGYGVIEEPNLLKIVNLKKAGEASLPGDDEVNFLSAGVISRVLTLPSAISAEDILAVFKSVAGSSVTIVPYLPTNTLIITGFARNVLRALKIGNKLIKEINKTRDRSVASAQVHIYIARHITAESLANLLTKLDSPFRVKKKTIAKKKISNANKKIRAVAHKESNSLVVTATHDEWRGIENIIKKLDVARTQILLEVLIAEVQSNKENQFGIDWRSLNSDGTQVGQFNSGLALGSGIVAPSTSGDGSLTVDPARNTLNGFSLGFLNSDQSILGILNANISKTNFNVLSSPQVMALNNQEAEISVGQDVSVQTRTQTTSTDGAILNSFEYKPSGINLKVTPQINPSGQITLNLFTEISTIVASTSTLNPNPSFLKRNIKTYITTSDKQTIVLGGLISSRVTKTVNKVPLLGDIPLIGYLFRSTSNTNVRNNLMVFITPHILKGKKQANRITDLKHAEQRESHKKLHNNIIIWPEESIKDD